MKETFLFFLSYFCVLLQKRDYIIYTYLANRNGGNQKVINFTDEEIDAIHFSVIRLESLTSSTISPTEA